MKSKLSKHLLAGLSLGSLVFALVACVDDDHYKIPDYTYEIPEFEGYDASNSSDASDRFADSDSLSDLFKNAESFDKLTEKFRVLKLERNSETYAKFSTILSRLQGEAKSMEASETLHPRAWSFGLINFEGFTPSTDYKNPKTFADEMEKAGAEHFVTYREAFSFAATEMSMDTLEEKDRFALAVTAKEEALLRLAVYQVAFEFSRDVIGASNVEVSKTFADKMSDVVKLPELSLAAYGDAFTFAMDERELPTVGKCSRFAKVYGDLNNEGVELFRIYKDAYLFAKETRELPEDSDRDAFAIEMSVRGKVDLRDYKKFYRFAKSDRGLTTDVEADKYAKERLPVADLD